MLGQRVIDLSMDVHNDMVVFPRVVRPSMAMFESWSEFANRIGAAQHGADWLTASYMMVTGDHVGTHIDARKHMLADAPGPEGIPLEYCYGDGVLLDFRDKPVGHFITTPDVQAALEKIEYTLKPRDIVLIHTGAGRINQTQEYLTNHCGMAGEATDWLVDQGIKVMGIDAPTFDAPVKTMFEHKRFWESHRIMMHKEYYHLENMMNFEQIPRPFGFKLAVFPIKWVGTTGAPVRAVAIVED